MANNKKLTEDTVALFIGCFIFILAALNLWGVDLLGWVLKTNMWTDMSNAFSATNKTYGNISGISSLLLTWLALSAVLGVGIKCLGANVGRFLVAFTIVFFIAEFFFMLGANAHIAATPNQQAKLGDYVVHRPDHRSGLYRGPDCGRADHQPVPEPGGETS